MFERMRSKFQCVTRWGQNCNVWEDDVKIPMRIKIEAEFKLMFGRVGQEFQLLQWKDKIRGKCV